MTWQITLERRDDEGLYHRTLTLRNNGDLVLEGHDLGRGVSDIFGHGLTEYEFVRTVRAGHLDEVRHALGLDSNGDLRTRLEERFARPGGCRAFEQFLKENDVPSEFWSRVGD